MVGKGRERPERRNGIRQTVPVRCSVRLGSVMCCEVFARLARLDRLGFLRARSSESLQPTPARLQPQPAAAPAPGPPGGPG